MKQINAWQQTVNIDGKECIITMIEQNGYYDLYLAVKNYTMQYMFGLPVWQQTAQEAFAIGLVNAPHYLQIFQLQGLFGG